MDQTGAAHAAVSVWVPTAVHAAHGVLVVVCAAAVAVLVAAPQRARATSGRLSALRSAAERGELVALAEQRVTAGPVARPRYLVVAAATASLAAALVHVGVAPEHLAESAAAGAFFAAAALAQCTWAVLVLRAAGRPVLLAGWVGSVALVLLWLVSRTLGVPPVLGGEGVEPVGLWDAAATACELVVVGCCAVALRRAEGNA